MAVRRIAYVLKYFPKLSQTFVGSELAELRRRGIEIRILALQGPPAGELQHHFVHRTGLDQLVTCGEANFTAVVREFKPQLLHAHFAIEATAAARTLSQIIDRPFTFTAHGYDIYRDPPADFAQRAAAAAAMVTVSEANARYIADNFGVPREHIRVIPCGVDTNLFRRDDTVRAEMPTPSGTAQESPLVVCVARHEPVKNLGLLLSACAILRDRGVDFRCVMVGEGVLRAELENIRRGLGLEPWVEMVGAAQQEEVVRWWRRAAVAVLCSHIEGMPVSLMEAGACEVPVVATRVGGIVELVEDGVTGLLTAPGDAPVFAQALERLLTNPALRIEMGRTARRRIEANFTLSMQVDRLLAMWSALEVLGPSAS